MSAQAPASIERSLQARSLVCRAHPRARFDSLALAILLEAGWARFRCLHAGDFATRRQWYCWHAVALLEETSRHNGAS